jgi:hypothetical protein
MLMQGTHTGLAKVAVQCSADTFVVNQNLVLRINICGKIATFAKPETVKLSKNPSLFHINFFIKPSFFSLSKT